MSRYQGLNQYDIKIVETVFELAKDNNESFEDAMAILDTHGYSCRIKDVPQADVVLTWED